MPEIVSINQPAYLPWLGYFQRIAASDLHVVLDHVQFEKNSFTNRNKIRTPQGWCWLTVPVKTKGRFGQLAIDTLEIDNASPWRAKHWKAIAQNYRKAPYFADYAESLRVLYEQPWTYLNAFCRALTEYLLSAFGIETPLLFSSQLSLHSVKSALVLDLCQHVGARYYLSGALGRDYLDEAAFQAAGIAVCYQDYRHPTYPQHRGNGFEPYLAAIDLLFNCGPDSLQILTGEVLDGALADDGLAAGDRTLPASSGDSA